MPKIVNGLPKYRRHSSRDLGFVEIQGRRTYFPGQFGSAESRQAYRRFCLEWETAGRPAEPPPQPDQITVVELLAGFMKWARTHYGSKSAELNCYAAAFRPLRELYGKTPAAEFGPKAAKVLQAGMIKADLCRKEINKRIGRIRRLFKWGVSEELVPSSVLHALMAVRGLARGRSAARDTEPVKPVADSHVDAIREHVVPQVWAMIEFQRFTGCRPGEVCAMRWCDVDTGVETWVYAPPNHKTSHHGHSRQIHIGPKARAVLETWRRDDATEHIFQPREAVEWLLEQRHASRKTPESYGNSPGTNRKKSPRRKAGARYTTGTYGNAIRRACRKAEIPEWHPHQLRHNVATTIRRSMGLDVARAVLGHRSTVVTEVYAELDGTQARDAMAKLG